MTWFVSKLFNKSSLTGVPFNLPGKVLFSVKISDTCPSYYCPGDINYWKLLYRKRSGHKVNTRWMSRQKLYWRRHV